MYPTLAKDERTNNDDSKNERRAGLYIYKNGLHPSLPSKLRAETPKPCVGCFLTFQCTVWAVLQSARTRLDKDNCTAECMFREKKLRRKEKRRVDKEKNNEKTQSKKEEELKDTKLKYMHNRHPRQRKRKRGKRNSRRSAKSCMGIRKELFITSMTGALLMIICRRIQNIQFLNTSSYWWWVYTPIIIFVHQHL